MAGFGGFLLAIAFIAAIYWFIMSRKAGKIRDVPFRKPSEIAQQGLSSADAKAQVSCEGAVQGQPIIAPASGQPCLYWEFELVRMWEKYTTDSNGNRSTSSGTTSVNTEKLGTVFMLNDGVGNVAIDCTKKPDTDLKQSHSSEVRIGMMLPGELLFGNLRMQVPHLPGGENVKGFRGVEKIVPFNAGQKMFALGKLTQGQWGWQLGDMGWSSLMLSDKDREATLGSAVKGAKIGMFTTAGSGGVGAIMLVLGLTVFAPKPDLAAIAAAAAAASANAAMSAAPMDSSMALPGPGDMASAMPSAAVPAKTTLPVKPGVKPATTAKPAVVVAPPKKK